MKKHMTALLYGWAFIIVLMLIASIVMAILLKFTSFNEPTLKWISFSIGLLALFLGGFFAGVKSKQRGWLIGMITGIGFTLLVFLVQYLGYKEGFSLQQLLHHSGYIFSALFGGILGVNISVSTEIK